MTETLTITKPDDWHLHLRDGDLMRAVLPYTAAQFARAIIMPNLVPQLSQRRMLNLIEIVFSLPFLRM